MKKILLSLILVGVLLASVTATVFAAPGDIIDPDILKQLAEAREATKQYQNAELPTADGVAGPYVQVSPYIPGMGYHYVNFALAFDGVVDEAAPEILLYADAGDGRRLVGVEYFFPIGPPDAPIPDPVPPAPILFGRPMDGPMPGHGPGEPPHYDLHVWLWQGNPDGIFEPFNPNLP
jgi:hypothetical protein